MRCKQWSNDASKFLASMAMRIEFAAQIIKHFWNCGFLFLFRSHLFSCSLGREGGGGSIFWKTPDTALYFTYVSILCFAWLTLCEWNCFTVSVSMRKLQSKKSKLPTMDKSYKRTTLFFLFILYLSLRTCVMFSCLYRAYIKLFIEYPCLCSFMNDRMSVSQCYNTWRFLEIEIWPLFLVRACSKNLYACLSFTVIKVRYGFLLAFVTIQKLSAITVLSCIMYCTWLCLLRNFMP